MIRRPTRFPPLPCSTHVRSAAGLVKLDTVMVSGCSDAATGSRDIYFVIRAELRQRLSGTGSRVPNRLTGPISMRPVVCSRDGRAAAGLVKLDTVMVSGCSDAATGSRD